MTPPLHELELLKRWGNHGEFLRKLRDLGLTSDLHIFERHVKTVGLAWFSLGRLHLADARVLLAGGATRGTYSRAYYAAYNLSKSVRFLVCGYVSLKGDDHKQIGGLPDDFPNASQWASDLESLYEDRLRADYDNWMDTAVRYKRCPADCVDVASRFENEAATYLAAKLGAAP
jgi:hypothetical protein